MDETFTYTGNAAGSPGNQQSFDGGDGNDTIHIFFDGETAAAPIVTDFVENEDGSFSATYRSTQNGGVNEDRVTITNIENVHIVLRNAYGPDNFPVPSRDVIRTGQGDDFISTAGGNDRIDSGRGIDTVDGGTGGDEFSESDVISKDFSDVSVDISWNIQTGAFAGPGSFINLEAFGTLLTGSGNDIIVSSSLANNSGLPGNEIIFTGAGNDIVTVANGIDDVDMGTGEDRLIVDYRAALFPGSVVSILNSNGDGSYSGEHRGVWNSGTQTGVTFEGVEHFTIYSAGSDDNLITGDGDDVVWGGAGNDRIDVGKGIDHVDGGGGGQFSNSDVVSKDFSDVDIDINWNLQTNQYSGPGSFTNLEAFGTLVTGSGHDTIVSGSLANNSGLPGNETISTGEGNDTVTVVNALDHVDLGAGEDRLIVDYRNANFPGVVTSVVSQNPDGSYSGEHRGNASSGLRTGVTFEGAEHFTIYSSGSSDNLVTGDGDDIVWGGFGNDRIDVGKGIDHVDGGAGDQFSNGDSVSKDFSDVDTDIVWNIQTNAFSGPGSFVNLEAFGTLVTGGGNDTIVTSRLSNGSGLPGNETIFTGAGDDVVAVYFANDIVDMGDGDDRLIVDYAAFQSAGNIVMTLNETSPGTYSGFVDPAGSSTDVTFAGVEHFTIRLQGGTDTIVTGNGDDIISTDVGNDNVSAGAGNDWIDGGGGNDTIEGGAGDDIIHGGLGADRLSGGDGADTFLYAAPNESAGSAADTIQGFQTGIDRIDLSAILALDVRWTESNGVNTVIVETADGDMKLIVEGALSASDFILGGNVVLGSAADDQLAGGDGNDFIDGRGGADTMKGGAGDDTYVVDDAGDRVVETRLDHGIDSVLSSVSFTFGAYVENLTLTGTAALDGIGNGRDNVITGNGAANLLAGKTGSDSLFAGGGDDILYGGGGDDRIDGGAGADRMQGGGGDDTYVVDHSGDMVVESFRGGIDTVESAITHALAGHVENLVLTGAAAIDGTGNGRVNTLTGNGAANLLDGKTGADTMAGGGGDDTYVVDHRFDRIIESTGGGIDTVRSSIDFGLGTEVENLVLTGTKAVWGVGRGLANVITGNSIANILKGWSGDDTLSGGAGDDFLDGGKGVDAMDGGEGDDIYVVDEADDVVLEFAGGGTDTVRSSLDYTLGGNVENLKLTGRAALDGEGNELDNSVIGNRAANTLHGGTGDDRLEGRNGADTLIGGEGHDVLVGEYGADRFVFETELDATTNVDTILDFKPGKDKIVLEDEIFDGLTVGALNPNALAIGAAAGDADDRIVYDPTTGALLFDADGSGAGAAVQFATLDNQPASLSSSDFSVI